MVAYCIGYIENAMHSGVLSTALRTLRVSRPNVHIALYSQPPATQIEGLRQRSLDFSLVDTPPTDSEQDLEYIQVLDDRMLLALPQNHPLAQEENLVASQLGDEQWIAVIHNDDAHSRDHFVAACVNAGFNPDIRLEAGEPLTALGLVAAGLGLALIQNSLRHNAPEGVVLRELPWMNYSTQLWAAWHKANQRPLVSHFRQILRGE